MQIRCAAEHKPQSGFLLSTSKTDFDRNGIPFRRLSYLRMARLCRRSENGVLRLYL